MIKNKDDKFYQKERFVNEETAPLNNNALALGGLQTFFLVIFSLILGIASNKNVICYLASLYPYILDL